MAKKDKPKLGIPIYLDFEDPEIDDPSKSVDSKHWYPANTIAIKISICLEAMRDVQRLLMILDEQEKPSSDRRVIKLLSTPLYNLATGVRNLFTELEGNAGQYKQLSKEQFSQIRIRYTSFSEEVPTSDGELKTIRDKISSHIDKDVFMGKAREFWELVDLKQQLEWMKNSLDSLMFILELDIFAWTRDSGNENIFRLMSVDGVQVDLDISKKLILGVSMVRSPKFYISSKVQELANLYGSLIKKCT